MYVLYTKTQSRLDPSLLDVNNSKCHYIRVFCILGYYITFTILKILCIYGACVEHLLSYKIEKIAPVTLSSLEPYGRINSKKVVFSILPNIFRGTWVVHEKKEAGPLHIVLFVFIIVFLVDWALLTVIPCVLFVVIFL